MSANDLTPEEHVRVQATIQKFVDASISKTVNAPNNHTVEDVKRLYTLAYDLGCKGIAYMREGSRDGVLERKITKTEVQQEQQPILPLIKPRPMMVNGATYKIETPVGKAYITININGGNQPMEVFINVGKAGSDVAAMAEGLGRLISLNLRIQSTIPPTERVKNIIEQLAGIGGSRHVGFGEKRVRSLPDAISKVMAKHIATNNQEMHANGHNHEEGYANGHSQVNTEQLEIDKPETGVTQQPLFLNKAKEFDLCPSCGEALLAHEEGCKKCYGCGYSEC